MQCVYNMRRPYKAHAERVTSNPVAPNNAATVADDAGVVVLGEKESQHLKTLAHARFIGYMGSLKR